MFLSNLVPIIAITLPVASLVTGSSHHEALRPRSYHESVARRVNAAEKRAVSFNAPHYSIYFYGMHCSGGAAETVKTDITDGL